MRILLVEDDESVARVLEKGLTDENYAVDVACDGHTGWQLVNASKYDLIVLDVLLPELDGLQFCRRLRERSYDMPVLLVTALNSSSKKIAGLNAGADDYITKPFELEELLARVRALLRRVQTSVLLTLEWGNLHLEANSRKVAYSENSLSLTPKEYGLLELFLRNPSQVFSRAAILDSLWSYTEAPGEETVTSHIKGLRRKLSNAGAPADLIQTVYGVGYCLKAIEQSPAETLANGGDVPSQSVPILASNPAEGELSLELRQQKTKAAMATLWNSVKFQHLQRLNVLKQAVKRLKTHQLSPETRQGAYRAAHSLNGALGIFGLSPGSDLAQAIEKILKGEAFINADQEEQLQKLTSELAQTLSAAIGPLPPRSARNDLPLLVLVDTHLQLVPSLVSQLWSEGLTVKVPLDLAVLQTLLVTIDSPQDSEADSPKDTSPDVVVFNFSFQESSSQALARLSALVHQIPALLVLICSADGALPVRVKASQLGSYPFLCNPTPANVLKGIRLLRSHSPSSGNKVLVVDDDPQILTALRTRLEHQGFQIVTLSQPFDFWPTLQAAAPDLLLLDIEMPKFSGLEVCQAVRQAPHWSRLPIVFFTAHTDSQTKQAALQVGANDLIEKSLPPSDLLTRLADQLKRSHLQQAIAAIADSASPEATAPS